MIKESSIEGNFQRWCKAQGHRALKLTLAGGAGFPDRTVLTKGGRIVFIEFKRPGGKLTSNQRRWITELTALGHIAVVCFSSQEARDVIEFCEGGYADV